MIAPASTGPMMREKFIATPFSASACGRWWRGTSSGTMAANTGQRIARPMPLAKVSASSSGALTASNATTAQVISPTTATHTCVTMKYWRRSRMSASAPLGSPSRNTGSVEADCTSATITGDEVSEVISQAAATSFIHMQALAVTHTPHSMRNTGWASGAQADTGAVAVAGTGGGPGSVE